MPNWCSNSLVLQHDDPAMIVRAKDAFAAGKFCQEFVPCPSELQETTSPNNKNADEMISKYGYPDWYSHHVSAWGTKWDIGSSDGINDVQENELTVFFDSAWSPPIALMEALEELGFTVNLMYDESGMAFCGQYTDGCDEYFEYGGMTADEIDAEIPSDINEAFCIGENRRIWEEEEKVND